MDVKLLFLTVVLLSSPLLTLCDPLFVLSAPNLLRVGSSENLFVEAQDYSGGNMNVKIIVKNHPKKSWEILSKSVTLTADNNFQILTDIKIPDDQNLFSANPLEKQYVYLQAQFPSVTLEQVVMLSFQSGYIFVQTDKPIYTPASTVAVFMLVSVFLKNPQGITVSSEKIFPVRGMKSGGYSIPQMASSGIWKVVTLFSNTPQTKFTADFEVKEYVLPTFEVKLKPSKSFFYVRDASLAVDIEAKYLFGQKVDGNAFVVFGVMEDEKKTSIPASLQKVQIVKGEGTAELTSQMITETFPNINQLVGRSIYVSVSLLTESGSEMVEAERRGIQIVTSPYTIHFKKTPHFFKPGMPFGVSVIYVTNPEQTPAEDVEVEVNPGGVRGRTRDNGIAKVTVNTPGGSSTLDITLQIGDPMTVYLNTGQSPGVSGKDFTYMVIYSHVRIQAEIIDLSKTFFPLAADCPFLSKRRRRSDDDDDDYYTDSEEIVSRTQFPESMIWEEIDLPTCRENHCGTTSITKAIFLRDSITTWQILAVSLSPTLGICVAEPEEMVVFKSFFIDLKMPYSAVRGEQLEIKAIIQNYTPINLKKVRVEFMETEDVCSSASKKGKYRTTVSVDKGSSIAVSYVIIPMTLGYHDIEVKASAYDFSDGVRKPLKVVSEGVLIPLHRENVELNPAKNGEKPLVFKSDIPADRLPDTPADTYISITAEEIAQTVEQAISGSFMGRFIVQPSGNGEQNMIYMTLPLIATHYLDSTNQWDTVGMERRNEAVNHIRTGYQRQLGYRKSDGSYAASRDRPSSTWLTAYVAKVFSMATNLVIIEDNVICSALKWLILHKQIQDGSFKEESAVMQGEMGDVRGKDADASLTAFVVIAMQEAREICAGSVGVSEFVSPRAGLLKHTFNGILNTSTLFIDTKILYRHMSRGVSNCTSIKFHVTACSPLSTLWSTYSHISHNIIITRESTYHIAYGCNQWSNYNEVISFRMHQMLNVGLLQPAAVTIYEYYSPVARCTKFYHPERKDGAIYRLCKGDLCQCAEVNCSFQKKNRVSDEERLNKACEAGMDYVYKVTVVGMDLKQDSDIYDMKVEQVLKEGTDEDAEGKVRQFLTRPGCREYLGLVEGKSYLIMGRSVDLTELGVSLQYVFGEQTWVEYWPTREESQTPEHRERYIGISVLKNSLLRYGCVL
uniref:NTR domain-containing protein n=1 Tax=Sinocyclocheilus rhinocerous TaxID=307959 RepID=A0A673LBY2_9TELE